MGIRIGVIADDFTGATDIASELVSNGFKTIQLNGVDHELPELDGTDAIVVSLKSRSIPAAEAVAQSLRALALVQRAGADQIYFKYCSTFDSTASGNIGPVTDALLAALGSNFTVLCPAVPVNGRTVQNGMLYVDGILLEESGMRNHPITPMTDSSIQRLMEQQALGRAGVVTTDAVEQGAKEVLEALGDLQASEVTYAVLDTQTDLHLETLGKALTQMPLVTGAAGLAGALAKALNSGERTQEVLFEPKSGPAVILSGSASVRTNEQVSSYKQLGPSLAIDIASLMRASSKYVDEVAAWFAGQDSAQWAPLIYATNAPEVVSATQDKYGAQAVSEKIESFFGTLAQQLSASGVTRFIVAGGETSGAVTTALGIDGFVVGPTIAPGVPWVRSLDNRIDLALKSGNFGQVDFFEAAQKWSKTDD